MKIGSLIILALFLSVTAVRAQEYEYDETPDPTYQVEKEAMRAHQLQYTNLLFQTMNLDTPGFIEPGGYNRRLKDGKKIRMIQFYRWRAGPMTETNNDLDFALDASSRGFFSVLVSGGTEGYTRDGCFTIDPQNRLVMVDGGYPVLGEKGIIHIDPGADVTSAVSGLIYADGEPVDKLKVAVFTAAGLNQLVDINGVIFALANPDAERVVGEQYYKVRQGFLEQNNVLKGIIGDGGILKRSYESTTKVLKVSTRSLSNTLQIGTP
jgi:flagellar basal body rod protein FlgG